MYMYTDKIQDSIFKKNGTNTQEKTNKKNTRTQTLLTGQPQYTMQYLLLPWRPSWRRCYRGPPPTDRSAAGCQDDMGGGGGGRHANTCSRNNAKDTPTDTM
ncbi:hypothetical protein JOB18_026431 [Solea senegalensis]|uniref:Uncharacterized protein n=1 Tax=Solea senegalensis TaxID=28829 RepID=A0AAV6QXR9_SOLSE|nr:hypothetical protein JOB18_026431 [Solea senegalensis]